MGGKLERGFASSGLQKPDDRLSPAKKNRDWIMVGLVREKKQVFLSWRFAKLRSLMVDDAWWFGQKKDEPWGSAGGWPKSISDRRIPVSMARENQSRVHCQPEFTGGA